MLVCSTDEQGLCFFNIQPSVAKPQSKTAYSEIEKRKKIGVPIFYFNNVDLIHQLILLQKMQKMTGRTRLICYFKLGNLEGFVNLSFQNRFHIDGDEHFVAYYDTAFLHVAVPAHPKIKAVNSGFRKEPGTSLWAFVNPVFPKRRLPLS